MLGPPYRVGPWPGLSPSGARVLLGCALLLALGQLMATGAQGALDLPGVAVTALIPMAIATRVVNAPGAASAVCGAYLLPRVLLSLADPSLRLPPLLLVASLAFDGVLWVRATDFKRRKRPRVSRQVGWARAAAAGAVFGLAFAVVEPPYEIFLGASSDTWTGPSVLVAGVLGGAGCALIATLSARGTASRPRGTPTR